MKITPGHMLARWLNGGSTSWREISCNIHHTPQILPLRIYMGLPLCSCIMMAESSIRMRGVINEVDLFLDIRMPLFFAEGFKNLPKRRQAHRLNRRLLSSNSLLFFMFLTFNNILKDILFTLRIFLRPYLIYFINLAYLILTNFL